MAWKLPDYTWLAFCLAGGLMTTRIGAATLSMLAYFVAGPAAAVSILIEPDNYAAGMNISAAVPGATLSTWSNSHSDGLFHYSPVSVSRDQNCIDDPYYCRAVTGSQLLGGPGFISERWGIAAIAGCFSNSAIRNGVQACGFGSEWAYGASALIVAFDRPTNFVEVTGTWTNDAIAMYAFDASFNIVAYSELYTNIDPKRCHVSLEFPQPTEYCANAPTVSSDTPQISYVLAGSWAGIGWLDTIRFNDLEQPTRVPEPGTLALFGLALAGLGLTKRRTAH